MDTTRAANEGYILFQYSIAMSYESHYGTPGREKGTLEITPEVFISLYTITI
jgi:hypothetical protein